MTVVSDMQEVQKYIAEIEKLLLKLSCHREKTEESYRLINQLIDSRELLIDTQIQLGEKIGLEGFDIV